MVTCLWRGWYFGQPWNANDANYSNVDYVFMTVVFGKDITMGTCVFRPVCSLSPITPMVAYRMVMPVYHRHRTHIFLSLSLLRWLFTLLLYVNMFALSFVALVALCQPCLCPWWVIMCVVNELIEGIRIRLVKNRGCFSDIGFSET